MDFKLTPQSCDLVLYQRTELLPKKSIFQSLVRRLTGKQQSELDYKRFVREVARDRLEEISRDYFRRMERIADALAPHIPKETGSILDVGCGIAGLDLYLYHRLDAPKIHLLDKTAVEEEIWYSFNEKGAFYNSLETARDVLVSNGVPVEKILCLEATDDGTIALPDRSVDLLVSTISWGFHYPVETYLEAAEQVLSETGVLILDVRNGTDGEAALKRHFSTAPIGSTRKHTTFLAKRYA